MTVVYMFFAGLSMGFVIGVAAMDRLDRDIQKQKNKIKELNKHVPTN
jgi:hypothetical protein